jgi:hypothetical protein
VVAAIGANGQLVLCGLAGSGGNALITGSSGSSGPPAFPITYAALFNSGTDSVSSTTSFQQAICRYDYAGFNMGSFQSLNYTSAMQAIRNYRTSNYPGTGSCNTGFFGGLDKWYQATDSPNAYDPMLTNFGLGNSPGAAPGAFLRSSWPSGTPVVGVSANTYTTNWGTQCPTVNVTTVGSLTGPGVVNWSQFSAWYYHQIRVNGNGSAMGAPSFPANPYVGHWINDNHFMYPRSTGCWGSNSTVYTENESNMNTVRPWGEAGWGQATAMYHKLAAAAGLTILAGGNCDGALFYGNTTNPMVIDTNGVMDLVFVEQPCKLCFGRQSTFAQGLIALMTYEGYNNFIPWQCMWSIENAGPNSSNTYPWPQSSWTSLIYWSGARYQFALAYLAWWRCGFGSPSPTSAIWLDELDAGVGSLKWLGTPSTSRLVSPTTGVYSPPNSAAATAYSTYGIITIPFSGGTVYLYPAGANDSVTGSAVTLPSGALQNGGGHHITYTVTPSAYIPSGVTSGAAFSSLTIQPRDAIFTKP